MSAIKSISWTVLGQGGAALGVLLGQRWLTGLVAPEVYGELVLWVGMAGLAMNVFCSPLTQAAIHAYPSWHSDRREDVLIKTLTEQLGRVLIGVSCAMIVLGGVAAWTGLARTTMMLLLVLMLFADSWRTAALAIVNAQEQHPRHALWTVSDTWLRALLAGVAVLAFGQTSNVAMGGYVAAALMLLPLAHRVLPLSSAAVSSDPALRRQLWTYAWPLVPLGIIGWVTGLADRYVIGSTLTIADVGIYAAAAGLASRPMLMLGTAIELVMRPRYQQAVSRGDSIGARRLILSWLICILLAGCSLVMFLVLCHQHVAEWLLGAQFRSGSYLMPWIAAGYWMLVTSYAFERICYAHGRTGRVLVIQACTAAIAVICLFVGARSYGLMGAAMSVPVYYSVQLLVSILQARMISQDQASAMRSVHA